MSSEEEMRIRQELGKEVERSMEDELKDGIYQLALRLHHLYHQQNEQRKNQVGSNKKIISSEVISINIRMEGGAKIELTEIKREMVDTKKPPIIGAIAAAASRTNTRCFVRAKKFDWTQTLRPEDGGRNVAHAGKKKKAFIC